MNNKQILLSVFIIVALAQLYVPAKMIFDREAILNKGTTFKFKTAPVDPNDIFRGKYIFLNFEENGIEVENAEDWEDNETVYLTFSTDSEDFASIQSVSKEKITNTRDFLKAKVNYTLVDSTNNHQLFAEYPFNRYYMEESKAYDAELLYQESQIDSNQVAYALVSIKDGEAVLKDVLIDGVSIREIVKQEKDKK